MLSSLRSILTSFVIILGFFVLAPSVHAATSTVCTVGCDYTTLNDAINADLPGPDGFLIDAGYFFVQNDEGFGDLTLPEDTFLTCDPSATLGNGEGSLTLRSNNQTVIDSCHFNGVILNADSVSDVRWSNNTAEAAIRSEFHLFNVTNYQITGNDHFSHTRMFNADDGLITQNEFNCLSPTDLNIGCFTSTFISIVPYDGSATTTDSIYISENLSITENTFTRDDSTQPFFLDFFGGNNIAVSDNIFLSLSFQDTSLLALRFYDVSNLNISYNTLDIFLPDNIPAGGGEAINLIAENQVSALIEHNTIIYRGVDSPTYNICFRVDKYGPANPADTITFRYNICTATDSVLENGFYIQNEVLTDIQFTEEYNAFYPVNDAFFYHWQWRNTR